MISGGGFASHRKRAEVLGVKHAYFGNEDKIASYEKIKTELGVTDADCAYMADEIFDIPVLERVGFAASLPHAPKEVQALAHYIAKRPAGNGAVRELTDLILEARRAKR
jgi:3-deoxy-D-manno-octulosonate 8-phosphate phosphatase (KDO 8-P phosphatase)